MIAAAVALSLLGFGLKCLLDGHRLRRDFELWKTAKPVDAPIDVSAPGRFVLPLEQTCSSSHGETVGLRVPAKAVQGTTITQLLSGLRAHLEIRSRSGSNVVASAESHGMWDEEPRDGAIPIFSVAPFRKGFYEATVTVTEGAPRLKGVTQRLEGRYLLCGLERMPATIASLIGAGSSGIGGIVGVIVFLRVSRDRRRRCPGQQDGPANGRQPFRSE